MHFTLSTQLPSSPVLFLLFISHFSFLFHIFPFSCSPFHIFSPTWTRPPPCEVRNLFDRIIINNCMNVPTYQRRPDGEKKANFVFKTFWPWLARNFAVVAPGVEVAHVFPLTDALRPLDKTEGYYFSTCVQQSWHSSKKKTLRYSGSLDFSYTGIHRRKIMVVL